MRRSIQHPTWSSAPSSGSSAASRPRCVDRRGGSPVRGRSIRTLGRLPRRRPTRLLCHELERWHHDDRPALASRQAGVRRSIGRTPASTNTQTSRRLQFGRTRLLLLAGSGSVRRPLLSLVREHPHRSNRSLAFRGKKGCTRWASHREHSCTRIPPRRRRPDGQLLPKEAAQRLD